MYKFISRIYRKPGLSDEQFFGDWRNRHGPIAARTVPGLRKYVQNHVVRKPGTDTDDVDGFAELWFDDREAFKKFLAWWRSDEAKELINEEQRLFDMSRLTTYIIEEHIIV